MIWIEISCVFVPEGQHDNSPMFQHWVPVWCCPSPEGTAEWLMSYVSFVGVKVSSPFGTEALVIRNPTLKLKRWAIIGCPSGTGE